MDDLEARNKKAWEDGWEAKSTSWTRAIAVVLAAIALGAAAASAMVWSVPERLPDTARALEIMALVTEVPPAEAPEGGGPSLVPQEDWPINGWWNTLLLGESSQRNAMYISWPDHPPFPADDEARRALFAEAEETLLADGWTIDRRPGGEGVNADHALVAHKDTAEVEVRADFTLSVDIYSRPHPTPAAPVIAGALAGGALALAWLVWRRRFAARHGVPAGRAGVVGAVMLIPSSCAVYFAAADSGWWGDGAPDLWEGARFYIPGMPFGLLMNVAFVLFIVDAVLLVTRARRSRRDNVLAA
ncbi:hypothetical protein AB0I28_08890 [Phytomonospora sp. NPDC050363]|uniref:hypothetical protein n=1 Tax=Phytomonospora sp. NPDC050363 TaxID=3155642 RepID=UPI00340B2464